MSSPILDPDLLKAFVAVADQRSFTRAAAMLNRTQSAVSMQIKRLEDRLQAELFHRTKANVDLSAAGEGLLGYARRILTLNDEAIGRLRERTVEGVVRLGVMDDYGTLVVPPLIASFVAGYPLIHIEMETGLTSSMTARLGEAYDLVIAMHPEGQGDGEFLRREQAVWAAGPQQAVEGANPLLLPFIRRAACSGNGRWKLSTRHSGPGGLPSSATAWRPSSSIAMQGLAVTVVKAGTFPSKLRRLSDRDGMPPLPAADIRLHRASNLSRPASLLADHLVEALNRQS